MGYDRFLIAPVRSGLQNNYPPFLIPEDAFQELNNAYVFRGRVKKRYGSTYSGADANTSRLRVNIGTTDGAGNLNIILTTPTNPQTTGAIGQQFTVGSETYTVIIANGAMLTTSPGGTGTFNTGTRNVILNGALANTAVYYYPAQPVMGLGVYENGPITNQPAIAFDMQNPYQFNGSSWEWLKGSTATPLFTGTNNDYFWTSTWRGAAANVRLFFVTNNVDNIWYWDGADWDTMIPIFNTNGDTVIKARIVLPFQGYTILLNTTEHVFGGGDGTFRNRARWSVYGSPLEAYSWLEPNQTNAGTFAQGAGVIDAATQEAIVGAEFIKDRLIVYFDQSTWELAFTGNGVKPFIWQKINTELGAIGTFSTVPFDKAVLGIGKTGVHACSGANVERIDQKIPDEIFDFKVKDNAYQRIWGVRIYQPELVAWTFVSQNAPTTSTFPNKTLIYNYENETWSFNDDCITCFGYFEQQSDLIWQNATMTWENANFEWNSFVQPAQQRNVIFGNQQGFIGVINPDQSRNIGNLQITNMNQVVNGTWALKIYNHNLDISSPDKDFILLENLTGITVNPLSKSIFSVIQLIDANTIWISTVIPDTAGVDALSGTYKGKGTAARVSRIEVVSKQWNPYLSTGKGLYLAKILFAVTATEQASIQVDYNSDASEEDFVFDSGPNGTNARIGTSILDTYHYDGFDTYASERLWHPVYFQGKGNCVQIRMYYNDAQMSVPLSSLANFEVQGIMLFTQSGTLEFA